MVKKSIFSYVLLAVFFISLLPYNAFHQHKDELHRIALIGNEENHHCDLDSYACQDDLLQNHSCQHQSHLSETTPDCFFCQFHFNNFFEISIPEFLHVFELGISLFFKSYFQFGIISFFDLLNKGPPQNFHF